MTGLNSVYITDIVKRALAEDIGSGDITTLLTVPVDVLSEARIVAKAYGVMAGLDVAAEAFRLAGSGVGFAPGMIDGATVEPGTVIANLTGPAHAILQGERVALNFLQHASGIATLTRHYVDLVAHTKAKIIDTRKTTPGLRQLEKYAVICGGGRNHRFNLSDGILIKDNHIEAAGGITSAVMAAKRNAPHTLKIECEVTTLNQLDEAITAGVDAVLLDNMDVDMLRQSVELVAGRVVTEASGGVSKDTVVAIAETGVDLISVGSITHSAPAVDISLQFK